MKKITYLGLSALTLLTLGFASCGKSKPKQAVQPQNKATDSLSNEALLDSVEHRTFNYFWQGADSVCGLAPERYHVDGVYPQHDQDIVATGGNGFGIMAMLGGMTRGYITREQGFERFSRIVSFLEKADRFHGVYPHWMYAHTGKVKPFGTKDDGGDLVETAYLFQGLLTLRQYYQNGNAQEKQLAKRIDTLWRGVDWNWYRDGQNVLYWHWSPDYHWQMNFPIHGFNECMITYVLAACSPTHAVPAAVYHQGWAQSGALEAPHQVEGYDLQLKSQVPPIGPLFWAHYSFLGLDPQGLKDRYTDYGQELTNFTLANRAYCVRNPKHYSNYGANCWGLTASYSVDGYAAHAPFESEDRGVISPTAAISSIVYTPQQSIQVIRKLYGMQNKVWGKFGFYDAFSVTANWYPQRYLAIDQGPEAVMIENYRSQLLWKLFMSCPEVQKGLKNLGFTSPFLKN